MRLRHSLLITFAAVSIVPLLLIGPVAFRSVEHALRSLDAERTTALVQAARAVVDRSFDELEHQSLQVAQHDDVLTFSRTENVDAASVAGPLAAELGLEVLEFLGPDGEILSSHHAPARLGEVEEDLRALLASRVVRTGASVDVAVATGFERLPCLLVIRPLDIGQRRVFIVTGRLLNRAWLDRAASVAQAVVRVDVGAGGSTQLSPNGFSEGSLRFTLAPSDDALNRTLQGMTVAMLALALATFALALLASFVLARRLSVPIEALTSASTRVAAGDWSTHLDPGGGQEIRALVSAFNAMTEALAVSTNDRLRAERVAAWRDAARMLAHELKNPLTPIRMSLETLQSLRARADARFASVFDNSSASMLEEVQRLTRIVDEFSQYARLPAPTLVELDLHDLVHRVMALQPSGRTVLHAQPGTRVLADADLLTQALVNLLKNAFEAMGETGQVTVTLRPSPGLVHLDVDDEGPGVPPEDRERIFAPWVTSKSHGTGLGLAIAQRIAVDHGGTLSLGEIPRGARFTLTLPALKTAGAGRTTL